MMRSLSLLGLVCLLTGRAWGQIDVQIGSLKIEPIWNGQTYASLGVGDYLYAFVDGTVVGTITSNGPSLTVPASAGTHVVRITSWYDGSSGSVTGTFVVSGGVTTTANVELNSAWGVIRGVVTENGGPLPANSYTVLDRSGTANSKRLPTTGVFQNLVPAGSRSGAVRKDSTEVLTFPYTALAGQEVDLGSPGALAFTPSVLTPTGTVGGVRTWPVRLTNTSSTAFLSVQITSLSVVRAAGPACTPTVQTATPINYGNFAAGASATQNISINFAGCASTTRFTMTATVSNGSATQTITRTNLFQ